MTENNSQPTPRNALEISMKKGIIMDYSNEQLRSLINDKGELIIPYGLKSLDKSAFEGCKALTSVVIPDSVTAIFHYAFHRCSSLKSIVFPNSLWHLCTDAFEGCSSLTSIEIAEDNPLFCSIDNVIYTKNRERLVFCPCGKSSVGAIPDSVKYIEGNAFGDCSLLTSIVLPDSVADIGRSAFEGCSSLTSIVIPNGVEHLGKAAFYGCSSLTSVVIPNSVRVIEDVAFRYCDALKVIKYSGTKEEWEKLRLDSETYEAVADVIVFEKCDD